MAPGWNWYRLDAEGIHRHGIAGRKVVPWHAVDTVLSRETVHDKTGRRVVTPFVVDARDRALLRLDGWVAHRGHLVRLILATARARQTARRRTVSRRPHEPAGPPR